MKILQSYPYFYPAWGYGGITRIVYELSKQLVIRGHSITVLTTDTLDKKNRIKRLSLPQKIEGVNTFYFKNISNYLTQKYNLSLPIGLIFQLNHIDCDLIHLHGGRSFQSIILYFYARFFNIPYIIQVHGDIPYYGKVKFKKIYDFFWGDCIFKNASCLIAVTKTEKKQYLQMGIPSNKIEIIPNGINLSDYLILPEYGLFRKKIGLQNNEKIILYLGRLHKRKGIDFLINSFSLLHRTDRVKLVIAGHDDGYRDLLFKQIRELGIEDRVIYVGPLDETQKYQALIDADILVYPGILEIFGLVPFEAIMCGTPVIVTDDCGCGELIKEAECGFLIKYGDVEGLKSKILLLINNDDTSEKMIINGQKFIRSKLAWQQVAEIFERKYQEIIRRSKKDNSYV
nr:glycosyltransferase family 4 protein [uncultured Methanoregula sp.]